MNYGRLPETSGAVGAVGLAAYGFTALAIGVGLVVVAAIGLRLGFRRNRAIDQ